MVSLIVELRKCCVRAELKKNEETVHFPAGDVLKKEIEVSSITSFFSAKPGVWPTFCLIFEIREVVEIWEYLGRTSSPAIEPAHKKAISNMLYIALQTVRCFIRLLII